MNYEANRLNTFNNWPSSAPVDPIRIAKAGFFSTGEGTEVKCFCCGNKISQWNYGDQVMWRHRQLKPDCPFVLQPDLSGNVPLVLGQEQRATVTNQALQSEDVQNDHTYTAHDYGLTEEDETYQNDALRLLSFVNWDDTLVSREALVNAGFYNAGEGLLRCAWCGGQLENFIHFRSEPPLEVHRMYFPRCQHAVSLEVAQQAQATNFSEPSSPTQTPSPPNEESRTETPPLNNQPQSMGILLHNEYQRLLSERKDCAKERSGAAHNQQVLSSGGTWRALGVVGSGARHPLFASLAERLACFARWPADRPQAPKALAEAGFFYTGTDDQVRCFYCDGGLGKWEAGDTPWSEHAFWFPHCGYVILVKGQGFIDATRRRHAVKHTVNISAERSRQRNTGGNNVTESQVEECMESAIAAAALEAGLDAARVRRAITRRLRNTGVPFSSSEALIDAVLDEQLNEEPWGVSQQSRLARDILAETFGDFPAPITRRNNASNQMDRLVESESEPESEEDHPLPSSPPPSRDTQPPAAPASKPPENTNTSDNVESTTETEGKKLSLEEENRQLKEARLCKVCMDSEVSVVFLPCGHMVSCGRCGAALGACPLCRAAVRALVRAYLA